PTRVPLARGADPPGGGPLEDELDLGIGQEAEPLPDLGRDRDLALRRDPHPPLHSYVRMVSVREGFSYGNVGRSASAGRRGGAEAAAGEAGEAGVARGADVAELPAGQ